MMNLRNLVALSTLAALAVVVPCASAQDDLDDLLEDLKQEAQEAAKSESAKAETKAEEPKAEAVKAEEPAAEEPKAEEPKAEESATEVAAVEEPAVEEPKAESEKEEVADASGEKSAAESTDAPKDEAPVAVVSTKTKPTGENAELIANLTATEQLRRRALDTQAKRYVALARESMAKKDYKEAVQHYDNATKLMTDGTASKPLRIECDQGIAEGLYRQALEAYDLGQIDRAFKLLDMAINKGHPKASREYARWKKNGIHVTEKKDVLVKHVQSEESYKAQREQIRKHLRRSRQYYALRQMQDALNECEMVLASDPYNQEAMRLRGEIQKKRQTIRRQERVGARDGMIADVDEAWRPVYAVNASRLSETSAETLKKDTGADPERTQEQEIEKRMKEMRLPTISFKPPATIMDAVEFFRQASVDYDRPDLPVEKRGFNFVLKTPQGALKAQVANEESDDFSSSGTDDTSSSNGLDPIPTITASDISFHEALKLVCDSVDYKFIVRGPVVMVMHKDMSTAELLSRKYDVLDAFLERMSSASSEIKEMRQAGFGGGNNKKAEDEENQEKDWKAFFEQMGVKWPEGSSIMYIKTLGKLYVRNTRENLAEFEKVLQEMGTQPKLIEIETRFVEVSQEDLNSLGFEWILNSDYSLDIGQHLSKALGINRSTWGSKTGSTTYSSTSSNSQSYDGSSSTKTTTSQGKTQTLQTGEGLGSSLLNKSSTMSSTQQTTYTPYSNGGRLMQDPSSKRTVGLNGFGGTSSDYGNGNRYLSTSGNHIAGTSTMNDQFMRVNAFLGNADLSMILHMLSQRSDTDLLSAPKVVTKSGENAVIKVVTEYIYPQDYDVQLQSSGSSGSGSSSSGSSQSAILAVVEPQNFTMREVGVILDVTPTYSEANGGTIDLELKPQVVDEPIWKDYGMKIPFTGNASSSTLPDLSSIIDSMVNALGTLSVPLTSDDRSNIGSRVVDTSMNAINNLSQSSSANMTWYDAPMEQPFFHVRSIDSKVSITPGATVVMGGLITEQRKAMDDKIPFLGDLPFIGRLFRSHAENTVKRNLLIFVTGRLITPSGRELKTGELAADEAEVKAAPEAE